MVKNNADLSGLWRNELGLSSKSFNDLSMA